MGRRIVMKELMKNYKVWLATSLTLLITIVAICISFTDNYHELEGYREKEYNTVEQQKVISKLTEENAKLKTVNTSVQSADSLMEMIQKYIKSYYNSDGTAEGYNINSQIVQAAIAAGVRFFMLGTNASMLKAKLTDALDGKTNIEAVFEQLPTEDQRDRKKNEIENSFAASRTIAVAGSQHRIGTTTQAL